MTDTQKVLPPDPYGKLPEFEIKYPEGSYFIQTCLDGSPTLLIAPEKQWDRSSSDLTSKRAERMHHPAGALSETVLVYGGGFEQAIQHVANSCQLSACVVGLGLGYIEMVIYAISVMRGVSLNLVSYESEERLRSSVRLWLDGVGTEVTVEKAVTNGTPDRLVDTIAQIAYMVESHFQMQNGSIRSGMKKLFDQGDWKIEGALKSRQSASRLGPSVTDLSENTSSANMPAIFSKFHYIAYDMFSTKVNSEYWSFDFLKMFLETSRDNNCVFSSYAANGALNRALKATGFKRVYRPGFSGKRESTLAIFPPDDM